MSSLTPMCLIVAVEPESDRDDDAAHFQPHVLQKCDYLMAEVLRDTYHKLLCPFEFRLLASH